MIRVIGIDKEGYPINVGVTDGTIEDVRKQAEELGVNIIEIFEEEK